jgi:hypothetical protein
MGKVGWVVLGAVLGALLLGGVMWIWMMARGLAHING